MDYAELFTELETALDNAGVRYAAHLSERQREAVTAPTRGTTVVIAGPGSGKTTVLVERIGYLLSNGVPPADLLVCAFTRAAADELQTRLARKRHKGRLPYCGTMHSLAFRMLGGQQWLMREGLTLISDEDQLGLLRALRTDWSVPADLTEKELLLSIQRAQEGASVGSDYAEFAKTWEGHLQSLGYIDFVMMLKRSLEQPCRHKFRFGLADEAQDLTPLQLKWLMRHTVKGAHIYLVGDDDQAVYAFRGSAQAVLADEVARGATCFQLRENWRSRENIIICAQQLIEHSSPRVAMPQTATRPDGDVTVAHFRDEAEELVALQSAKVPPIVLCRTRIEVERFQLAGITAFTMHEAKGREWPYVWVSGLEQGACPHALGDIEEERHLFYVALTRAQDRLTVAVRSRVNARPRRASQFLREAGLVI